MNHFTEHLKTFYYRVIELRHTSYYINNLLIESKAEIEKRNLNFISASILVISDWTGKTDDGWTINYDTGIRKISRKEYYGDEVQRIISQECCNAFVQVFEAFEGLLKSLIKVKSVSDPKFKMEVDKKKSKSRLKNKEDFLRGETLFELIKKASGQNFELYSKENNEGIRFKEFWTVLSEVRHAVVHSGSKIKNEKIQKSVYHTQLFSHHFKAVEIDAQSLLIELDYDSLDGLLKKISEFSYQIYKLLSLSEQVECEILE